MDTSGHVKLLVKAPNQQFEDQTIECDPLWTIKRLKVHLSEVYPCKPTLDEQKLIYAGQLLKDQVILKDILRHYDGPQPQFHTFHLVYTPKNRHTLQNSINTTQKSVDVRTNDGLRQRNVPINQIPEISSQTAPIVPNIIPTVASSATTNCPMSGPPGGINNIPAFGFPHPPNQYEQMAMQNWLQQAYIQYMNQYMNLLSIGVRPETVFMQAQPQMPYFPQNVPFSPPNLAANLPHSTFPSQASAPPVAEAQVPDGDNIPNAGVAAVQQQPAANPQPQQRFPNLVQDDPQENRDWLDVFYSMIRVMVLLTLVYFYSSPLRCTVVVFIGLAIYLYHIGWFRTQPAQVREANNNNVAAAVENIQQQQQHDQDANGAQPNNNVAGVQNEQQPAGAATPEGLTPNSVGDGDVASNLIPGTPEANGTSVIAFVRTFVVSFFVSLLPETPAL